MRWSNSITVRTAPGFIEPCLPSNAAQAPTGLDWVYEAKHDGYRLMVRKKDGRVRIYTRRGADWTKRFPRIVEAVGKLNVRSILLDGEGIICTPEGLADFTLIRSRDNRARVTVRQHSNLCDACGNRSRFTFELPSRAGGLKRLVLAEGREGLRKE